VARVCRLRVAAERLFPLVEADGALHLIAKRGDAAAVTWLLDRGADPNGLWSHWGAEVTPLHLAASRGHANVVRLLLERGADPNVRDSMHDSDMPGWAEFFQQAEILEILRRPPRARPHRPACDHAGATQATGGPWQSAMLSRSRARR
jgi:hypothetical protein